MTPYPVIEASVTADQARAIARGLLSDAGSAGGWEVESTSAFHPLWVFEFRVVTGATRASHLPAGLLVTVDAVSGRGALVADDALAASLVAALAGTAQNAGQVSPVAQLLGKGSQPSIPRFAAPHRPAEVDPAVAERSARALAATAVRRRAKLGVSFDLALGKPATLMLKPNWVVTARSGTVHTKLLIDGFDGSHYVISYAA